MNWKLWTKAALIRCIKTIAQAAVACIGTGAVISEIDWKYIVSASVVAGILSLLTSLAGLPEVNTKSGFNLETLDELSNGRGDDDE